MSRQSIPYSTASSGTAARGEITAILKRFGCSSIGFMDDFDHHELLLAFTHHGRNVQLRASARGWAAMYLKANPWNRRRALTQAGYERDALERGMIAVNSILRDWVKGQVTAVECGILSFGAVFFPYMLTSDGRPLIEAVVAQGLLPAPESSHD